MTIQTATTMRSGIIGPKRTAPQAASLPSEAEITAFLADPSSYPERPERVDLIETHAARIFLAGEDVLKIKKHVRLPYLDFTTLSAREATLTRELELNRPAAPDIYLGIKRITRESSGGGLAFDGAGETVEFALHMRRFAQEDVLGQAAVDGRIGRPLAKAMADVVFTAHEAAPVARDGDGIARFEKIIADVAETCAASRDAQIRSQRATFANEARVHLDRVRPLLAERARAGFRRRCHGDLHLGNMVLWYGQPLPFDALEFDEDLATIDVLYDLAFLIMDLEHRELRPRANDILNRYLWRADVRNLEGLAALPLFLALRAGIRTMVDLHRIAGADAPMPDVLTDAQRYLGQALQYLAPARPALIAVGGLSGSGKSTLAAALAPAFGVAPGAIHLRSDLERKKLFQIGETERLPDEAYARTVTQTVYATLNQKAASVIAAGYAVIVDAVHSAPEERATVERVAQELALPFLGLWLDAPGAVLKDRVTMRKGDASDATADVITQQLTYDLGDITWHRLDASQPFEKTCANAETLIEALGHAGAKET